MTSERGTFYNGRTAISHRAEPEDHHAPVPPQWPFSKIPLDYDEYPGTAIWACESCQKSIAWREEEQPLLTDTVTDTAQSKESSDEGKSGPS